MLLLLRVRTTAQLRIRVRTAQSQAVFLTMTSSCMRFVCNLCKLPCDVGVGVVLVLLCLFFGLRELGLWDCEMGFREDLVR